MKKLFTNKHAALFDLAPAPTLLASLKVPALIVVAVIILVFIALILIRRAQGKK